MTWRLGRLDGEISALGRIPFSNGGLWSRRNAHFRFANGVSLDAQHLVP
jgi:hypothetical protein